VGGLKRSDRCLGVGLWIEPSMRRAMGGADEHSNECIKTIEACDSLDPRDSFCHAARGNLQMDYAGEETKGTAPGRVDVVVEVETPVEKVRQVRVAQ
jgi:hypothetical protein